MKKKTQYDELIDFQMKKKNVSTLNKIKKEVIYNAIKKEVLGRSV